MDFDSFFSSDTECEFVVTNCETGLAEYKGDFADKAEFFAYSKASCSLPFICAPVEVNGNLYLDGSITDSIPFERAFEKECDKAVVVMTKPRGSVATDYGRRRRLVAGYYKKYPELCEAMYRRKEEYKKQEELLYKLEAEGKVFIIRPTEIRIKRFEKDMSKVQSFYDLGYNSMCRYFSDLMNFI